MRPEADNQRCVKMLNKIFEALQHDFFEYAVDVELFDDYTKYLCKLGEYTQELRKYFAHE